ncbi:hypothetical protein [Pedobacter sp. SYSU D00535]|uniref:hypothetical protein n=1 Tax=Pedobacter sp. SYSU D00535 TaxID=2810308 RepID=UPI001A97B6C6|nr:hypothetical protein [Pedobacter sp. SYSU D00535]
MANTNPTQTKDPQSYADFSIDEQYSGSDIYLSTETIISEPGWQLDLTHVLSLDGNPLDFDANPDIKRLMLGTGANLDGMQFALCSAAARIRNGAASSDPPPVSYKFKLEAGGTTIAEFTTTTDKTNPVSLYTKITFKLQS